MTNVKDVKDALIILVEHSHLKAPLEDLLSLGSPHCAVDSDLLVPPDTEAPDGVASLGEDRGLSS